VSGSFRPLVPPSDTPKKGLTEGPSAFRALRGPRPRVMGRRSPAFQRRRAGNVPVTFLAVDRTRRRTPGTTIPREIRFLPTHATCRLRFAASDEGEHCRRKLNFLQSQLRRVEDRLGMMAASASCTKAYAARRDPRQVLLNHGLPWMQIACRLSWEVVGDLRGPAPADLPVPRSPFILPDYGFPAVVFPNAS